LLNIYMCKKPTFITHGKFSGNAFLLGGTVMGGDPKSWSAKILPCKVHCFIFQANNGHGQ